MATNVGIAGLFLLNSDFNWVLRKGKGDEITQKIVRRKNRSELKNLNAGFDFSLGVGYNLSDEITIKLQPEINYLLFKYENTDIKNELYNIGRFIDENQSTQERLFSYGINISIIKNL